MKILLPVLFMFFCLRAIAEPLFIELKLQNHLFTPEVLNLPANQPITLIIHNKDQTAEEFESHDLSREKLLLPKSSTKIFLGPLKPGIYSFFGEFNSNTAIGKILVAENIDP